MDRAPAASGEPTRTRRALRIACGVVLFVLLGYLGRRTVIYEQSVSLIWPAAGVAALWLASGSRRTWPGDAAALAVATFAVNITTGATIGTSLAFTVSNLLQVAVFVVLVRRWMGHTWGLGGTEPITRLADLGLLVAASVSACLVGTAAGVTGLWITAELPDPTIIVCST